MKYQVRYSVSDLLLRDDIVEQATEFYNKQTMKKRFVLNKYGILLTDPVSIRVITDGFASGGLITAIHGEKPMSKHAQSLWDALVEQLMSENIE